MRKSRTSTFSISIQSGLGLPDRDYYWDDKFKAKLAAYQAYIEQMLTLAKIADAKQAAADIVALETRIAKAQWSKVENRDADKTYNKMDLAELAKLTPGFDWQLYFQSIGVKDVKEVVVSQPSYLTSMAELLDTVPLATWKVWLKLNTIHRYASLLNKELADADFAFYGTTLHGVPENRPRWKRGVAAVEGCLGEAVGKLYVEKRFPPEAKERMDQMVKNILDAYRLSFQELDWMSPETKEKALAKLATFTPKIGYPKKWRDYSALEIRRDDLVGNIDRHAIYEWNRDLAKLGKPVDRDEWHMTPQTINAYYNPSQNEIVFPAAILQPPFFNLAADDAVNYGGIGAVIGHEIGHGFDDQGSKWDGAGNLQQWWTPADRAEFDKRGDALAAQYDRLRAVPRLQSQRPLHAGREYRRLGGPDDRLSGLSPFAGQQSGPGDRRPDRRPAILSRLGPGLAAKASRSGSEESSGHRSALARRISGERHRAELAGILFGIRRQGRRQALSAAGAAGKDLVMRVTLNVDDNRKYSSSSCTVL